MKSDFVRSSLPEKYAGLILLSAGLIPIVCSLQQVASGQTSDKAAQMGFTPAGGRKALAPVQGESETMKVFALRLRPGQDLRLEIERFVKAKGIKAGFIITTVGSLAKATLRFADQSNSSSFDAKFEIVSLVGTIAPDGVDLHLSISDGNGKTIGRHLVEGCQVYTTAEILIGDAKRIRFSREPDSGTGYKELRSRAVRRKVRKGN